MVCGQTPVITSLTALLQQLNWSPDFQSPGLGSTGEIYLLKRVTRFDVVTCVSSHMPGLLLIVDVQLFAFTQKIM